MAIECRCFKCEKILEAAGEDDVLEAWDMPHLGVVFFGGDNYGSRLYDSMHDGLRVRLVVCDECLSNNRRLYQEIRTNLHDKKKL